MGNCECFSKRGQKESVGFGLGFERGSKEAQLALHWMLLEKEGISVFGCFVGSTVTTIFICA